MKFICTLLTICVTGILFAQHDTTAAFHARDSMRDSRSNFTWGPDLSLGYNYRTISSKGYAELIESRNTEESCALLWNFGLLLHFRLSGHVDFTTGLRSTRTGFTLKEELRLSDTLTYEYGAACDVYHAMDPVDGWKVPYVFSDPRYGFVLSGYHPSHAELNMNVTYRYLEVPLKFRFILPAHRLRYSLNAGVSPDYMVRQIIHDAFESDGIPIGTADVNETPGAHLHRFNIGATSGFAIGYHLKHNTDIEFHTDATWQMRELFDQQNILVMDYHEHHYRIEAGISLCYYPVNTEDKR